MVKQNVVTFLATLVLGVFSAPAQALDAASADDLAQTVLQQLGRTKGICAIPNCGDGQLARAFLQRSGMKVHAFDDDTANVRATRQLMESIGVYGAPAFYADRGGLSLMPYADRFVDCIVITGLTDADLAGVSYTEIQRALCPDGMAWVGRATVEGAGITQTALQNWINAASRNWSSATVSTTDGTWAVITRRELSGVDVWPRHRYDVNGTRYSKDSVASFPWLPQAKTKPYRTPHPNRASVGTTMVTSGGRTYTIAPDIDVSGAYTSAPSIWLRARSIYNGELLWKRNVTSEGNTVSAYGPDLYLTRGSGILRLNGLTGAEMGTVSSVPSAPQSPLGMPTNGLTWGCGPRSASINFTYSGVNVFGYDLRSNKQMCGHNYKPPCGVTGVVVSNGFMINPLPSCDCMTNRYWGTHVDASAGSFAFDRSAAADGSDRIERGPAFSAEEQVVPSSQDWPTHRSTVVRNGRSASSVPNTAAGANMMWNWAPPANLVTSASTVWYDDTPEEEPTPPVVVGAYTFVGSSDGYVRCISGGTLVWAYATGGRIYATPTVWQGRVYVGSGDGYMYCLEAHTGRLAWRFRSSPEVRRMGLFGYLTSMWPVNTGVLIHNGNAYFASGIQSEYGTHVYCVNALTGALVWQNNRSSTWLDTDDRMGYTPCGYMTVSRNRLVAANNIGTMVSFDLATGAIDPVPSWMASQTVQMMIFQLDATSLGREIGVVNGSFIVNGGSRLFRDHHMYAMQYFTGDRVGYCELDANGAPVYPKVFFSFGTSLAPAWSDQDFYQCMYNGTRRLEKYAVSDMTSKIDVEAAANPTPRGMANREAPNSLTEAPAWWPTAQWSRRDLCFNAIALAANGIVTTYAKAMVGVPENVDWYVGVLSTTDGTTLWERALPNVPGTNLKGEPLYQGLAVDRNGDIVVVQKNGNVLCYGGGQVSVVVDSLHRPTTPPPPASLALAPGGSAGSPCPLPRPGEGACALAQTAAPVGPHQRALVIEAPTYDASRDSSDMGYVNGVFTHTVPPQERGPNATHKLRDMVWHPERECLLVASVTATSSARATSASSTIDRDLASRWSPAGNGRQSITYDLGTAREVSAISVVWYAAKANRTALAIETSPDSKQFTRADEGMLTGRGTNTALRSFLPVEARYIRITLDAPVSVYEVGIHGAAGDRQAAVR